MLKLSTIRLRQATPISFIFKVLFIIAGVILLIYILSAAAGGLKSLYYGSPFLFLIGYYFLDQEIN